MHQFEADMDTASDEETNRERELEVELEKVRAELGVLRGETDVSAATTRLLEMASITVDTVLDEARREADELVEEISGEAERRRDEASRIAAEAEAVAERLTTEAEAAEVVVEAAKLEAAAAEAETEAARSIAADIVAQAEADAAAHAESERAKAQEQLDALAEARATLDADRREFDEFQAELRERVQGLGEAMVAVMSTASPLGVGHELAGITLDELEMPSTGMSSSEMSSTEMDLADDAVAEADDAVADDEADTDSTALDTVQWDEDLTDDDTDADALADAGTEAETDTDAFAEAETDTDDAPAGVPIFGEARSTAMPTDDTDDDTIPDEAIDEVAEAEDTIEEITEGDAPTFVAGFDSELDTTADDTDTDSDSADADPVSLGWAPAAVTTDEATVDEDDSDGPESTPDDVWHDVDNGAWGNSAPPSIWGAPATPVVADDSAEASADEDDALEDSALEDSADEDSVDEPVGHVGFWREVETTAVAEETNPTPSGWNDPFGDFETVESGDSAADEDESEAPATAGLFGSVAGPVPFAGDDTALEDAAEEPTGIFGRHGARLLEQTSGEQLNSAIDGDDTEADARFQDFFDGDDADDPSRDWLLRPEQS